MVLDPCSNLPVGLALELSDKAQKSQLSTLGDKVNYMSPPEAGWGPRGRKTPHKPTDLFHFKLQRFCEVQPLCLAFWIWACQLPFCCRGGQMAREQGWLGMATGSQLARPGTSSQLNYHWELKKDS